MKTQHIQKKKKFEETLRDNQTSPLLHCFKKKFPFIILNDLVAVIWCKLFVMCYFHLIFFQILVFIIKFKNIGAKYHMLYHDVFQLLGHQVVSKIFIL